MTWTPYIVVIVSSIIGAIGQLFFKLGSAKISNLYSLLTNYSLIIGLCLYGIATILYIFALRMGDLSVLYPLIALSYVWVSFLSYFVLKEPVSIVNFIGYAVIIVGVSLAAYR